MSRSRIAGWPLKKRSACFRFGRAALSDRRRLPSSSSARTGALNSCSAHWRLIRVGLSDKLNLFRFGAAHGAGPNEAALTKFCIPFHGPDHQASELLIEQLSCDFKLGGEALRWAEMVQRVIAGEMRPAENP